ncbi:MAG: 2,3-dihydroxyphenylpropionate 1,2-dioxygenase [Pseudomonadota bacterium]
MAELVGVYAASHTPVMLNFPHALEAADRNAIFARFAELGETIAAAKPEVVLIVSDDHLHNFFLDNFPAFCIGAADSYRTPAEHWLKAEKQVLEGDASFGAHLLGEALKAGFDPSFSMQLTLDHGVLTPLLLSGLAAKVRIVPLLINCVQPPFPTMQRCRDWGRFIRTAIHSYPGAQRVAVLATGGISHDVATPRMGFVNEAFDREFLRLLSVRDAGELVRYSTDHVNDAGNGAEEIRNWLVAHGVADGAPFHTLYYKALEAWYAGIAIGYWRL